MGTDKAGRREICIVVGTRPDIIKMSPVIRALTRRHARFFVLHSGQHTRPSMDAAFFRELGLPAPRLRLPRVARARRRTPGHLLSLLIGDFERAFAESRPACVVVQGDTHSAFAAALAAAHLAIPVAHVEAGLRSDDRSMPEELNRVLADHLASVLFAPTPGAARRLRREGIDRQRIVVTGNTVVDALRQNLRLARCRSRILDRLALKRRAFVLLTLHRAENLNAPDRLRGILAGVERVGAALGQPVVLPMHPSLARALARLRVRLPSSVLAIEPLGHFDFLTLAAAAHLTLTDSGGVQEEATVLRVPCVTLRDNTERPESVAVGANRLAGTDPTRIALAARRMAARPRRWPNPFGDGHAGERIAGLLMRQVNTSAGELGPVGRRRNGA